MSIRDYVKGYLEQTLRAARMSVRYRESARRYEPELWRDGELVDLSIAGARFWCPEPVEPGSAMEVRLSMVINGRREEIELPCVCEGADEAGVAVRFLELNDLARRNLGDQIARMARKDASRPTMKRLPRTLMQLAPGAATSVL